MSLAIPVNVCPTCSPSRREVESTRRLRRRRFVRDDVEWIAAADGAQAARDAARIREEIRMLAALR